MNISNQARSWRVAVFLTCCACIVMFCLAGTLVGCISRPALRHEYFALQSPPLALVKSSGGSVVSLRPVQVSAIYDRRAFVYRAGPESYEIDNYAGFIAPPGRLIGIPIRAYLLNSGLFKDVVEPGSAISAGKIIEVYVVDLYGDFQNSDAPAAVLSLRIHMYDAEDLKSDLDKSYFSRVPLKNRSAAAVAAGWSQALDEIMKQLDEDMTISLKVNNR
jgi:ABC-type uncharacterized transport system auxiliary subunit